MSSEDLKACGVNLCNDCDIKIENVIRSGIPILSDWLSSGGDANLKHVGGDTINGDHILTRKPHSSNSDWQVGDVIVVRKKSNAICANVNECIEDPSLCGSGGTCVDMAPTIEDPRKYKCDCDAQHHGVHCQNEHDDCEGDSDREISDREISDRKMCDHGTCVDLDRTTHNETAFRCECDINYELDDQGRCSIVKTCDGSHFEMTEGMIPFARSYEDLPPYGTSPYKYLPPCEHDGYCPKETGYCIYYETEGDVERPLIRNQGVVPLGNASSADSCLQKCKARTDIKGCEYVVEQ